MIILDAPLAGAVRPFIGDAIVSSLLGYSDPEWAVRNSATMVFSAAMLRVVDADKNASNTDRTASQAVTVTELFRRYPALSTFLPAMMEHCLVDQDEQVNSQLFPILQLLSRTQPVAHSGGAAATHGYPDTIRKALNNKHHAVRAVAARSLANVCSDEIDSPSSFLSSLETCHYEVAQSHGGIVPDWNQIDGNLLAISSMASSSFTVRNKLFDLGIHLTLKRMIQLVGGPVRYPPSCISIAVDVLAQLTVDPNERKYLISSCAAFVENGTFEHLPGGALVYESAAKATIMLVQCDVWDPCDTSTFYDSLVRLQSLFSSDFIDVRLVAVKAFKKTIYSLIDRIVLEKGKVVAADQILSQIAGSLLRSTEKEMDRQGSVHDCLGPHVPTARRLSRCFLECFDGYQRLSETSAKSFMVQMVQIGEQDGALWQTAMAMVEHEQFLKEPAVQANGETFLSGNAVELMSIQIAADIMSESLEDEKLKIFVKVICRLNDSQASWRSRFSASKAIENSHVLTLSTDSKWRGQILRETLKMLQDSDPDVRSCASRAARQVEKLEQTESVAAASPLLGLYPLVYHSASQDEAMTSTMINSLLKTILENSQNLLATMQALDIELEQTRATVDHSTVTNSASRRRIFEEEDPNPFNERVLSNQLAIRALLQFPPNEDPAATIETSQDLLGDVSTVLTIIRDSIADRDLIHDLSRFPAIFPSLQGLLGAAVACIFLGISEKDDTDRIQRMAEIILESPTPSLHPEILAVTECLFTARRGDTSTKIALEKSLFLL
jgi:hypothetical protein